MTDTHYEFLVNLPTVVIGKNGFVGIHVVLRVPSLVLRISLIRVLKRLRAPPGIVLLSRIVVDTL